MEGGEVGLIYKDLSYAVVGCLYEVDNELGSGHPEKVYQRALSVAFKNRGLTYERELFVPLEIFGEEVGRYYFDFLLEGKVVVELKVGKRLSQRNFNQVKKYLKSKNYKLGILAVFSPCGVIYARVVNAYERSS